jgi:hypothetical protein
LLDTSSCSSSTSQLSPRLGGPGSAFKPYARCRLKKVFHSSCQFLEGSATPCASPLWPSIFRIILYLSTTLLTGITSISLHMQWPLTSQSHGNLMIDFTKLYVRRNFHP